MPSHAAQSSVEVRASEGTPTSSANSFNIALSAGVTNASFAESICESNFSYVMVTGPSTALFYEVPDCFFETSTSLETIDAYNLIIRGNATFPDPLDRLPASLVSINARSFRFIKYTGPANPPLINAQWPYSPDWTAFADNHPNVQTLSLTNSGLLTAPDYVPSLITRLTLNNNLMNGTIPLTMLSRLVYNPLTFSINLSYNQLTGTIPLLFSTILDSNGIPKFTTASLQILFQSNRLTGSLPAGLFTSVNVTDSLYLDLSSIGATGTIPNNFLGPSLKDTKKLFIYLQSNSLFNAIPSDLLTSTTATQAVQWSLDLRYNILSGSLNPALLRFAAPSSAQMISIFVSNNSLSGVVPNLFDGNPYTSLHTFYFIADGNQFSGFDSKFLDSAAASYTATIDLSNNKMEGAFPTLLLQNQNFDYFSFNFANNLLTGNPFDAIVNLLPTTSLRSLYWTGTKNSFSGAVPPHLFTAFSKTTTSSSHIYAQLFFAENAFTDPLSEGIFGGCENTVPLSVVLDISNNQIAGPVPTSLWGTSSPFIGITELTFIANHNKLTGPLPPALFDGAQSGIEIIAVDYSSNEITSSLPAAFLSGAPFSINSISLSLDNNNLGAGGIPEGFFDPTPSVNLLTVSLINCNLPGRLPSMLVNASRVSTASIILDNNSLVGSFNTAQLVAPWVDSGTTVRYIAISASSNKFNESLTVSSTLTPPRVNLQLKLANNGFTSLSLSDTNSFLSVLDITENVNITGTLPSNLFESSVLNTFIATRTLLSGTMPQSTTLSNLALLDMRYSNGVDFCNPDSRPKFDPQYLVDCKLLNTRATGCVSKYPAKCFSIATCDNSTRPSPPNLFFCQNNVWTAVGSDLPTTITIPAGSTTTVIQGSVDTTTVIFNGVGATLIIQGCANNLTSITIQLTPTQIETLSTKELHAFITYNDSDATCKGLEGVAVHVTTTKSTCKRVKAIPTIKPGQFAALFTVDSSHCKTWWIILVSVLGGLVVIAIIVVVLLVALVPSIRMKVRPYSKARAKQGQI